MRILVATDQWFPDVLGGVARYATDLAGRWARAGHEVTVLAPRHPVRAQPERLEDGRLTVLRVLPRGPLPRTATDAYATWRSAASLRSTAWDVTVAHTSTTAIGLARARLGAPLVYVFHADPARESRYERSVAQPERRDPRAALLERVLGSVTRAALRTSTSVVVLSEFSRGLVGDLDHLSLGHTVLVPGAVDTTRFHPDGREAARAQLGIAEATRLVFTVRRLVPRMGLPTLLDAIPVLREGAGLRLTIGGTGHLEGELRQQCARLGIEHRVDFLGSLGEHMLPIWHRAADVFALPTIGYEGFGLVTAEALASGTPVVGTTAGATPELIAPLDSRLLAAPGDAQDLARALSVALALATPAFRERCRAHAVSHYAWDAVLPAWDEVLGLRRAGPGGQ